MPNFNTGHPGGGFGEMMLYTTRYGGTKMEAQNRISIGDYRHVDDFVQA